LSGVEREGGGEREEGRGGGGGIKGGREGSDESENAHHAANPAPELANVDAIVKRNLGNNLWRQARCEERRLRVGSSKQLGECPCAVLPPALATCLEDVWMALRKGEFSVRIQLEVVAASLCVEQDHA